MLGVTRWCRAGIATLALTAAVELAHAANCCVITSINLRTGIVTAEDVTTRQRHEIAVKNAVLLNRLKRGQAVDVDLESRKATIEGVAGRFSLHDEAAARAEAEAPPPAIAQQRAPGQVAPAPEAERFEAPAPPPIPERRAEQSYEASSPYPQGESAPLARQESAPPPPPPDRGSAPGRQSMRDKGPARRDPRAEEPPNDDANEDEEPDPPKLKGRRGKVATRGAGGGKTVRLDKYPDARGFLNKLAEAFTRKEINVALLGGEKYMINKCLGIKVRAGTFKLKLASPNARLEGSGAKLTFRVDRISLNGISLRMRPNSNVLKPCHFSKKFSVGGSASDVRLQWSFDPLLNLSNCKLGSFRNVHTRVDIGNLNLKPLQNDLDRIAKNMIEDALNYAFEFDPNDQLIQTIDDVLEVDCPGKRAQVG